MLLWHFHIYVLQLPHAAEEVSCKSSAPLKVEAVDKKMCLHYLLESAKYQPCFRELANLFCREEMDGGRVFRACARRRENKSLPICQHQRIFQYIIL